MSSIKHLALHIGTFSPKDGEVSNLQKTLQDANDDASTNPSVRHSIVAECNAKSDESTTVPRTFGIFFTYDSADKREKHLNEINASDGLASRILQYTKEDDLPQNMLDVLSFHKNTQNLHQNGTTLALGLRAKLTLKNTDSKDKVVKYLSDTVINDLTDEPQTLVWCAFRVTNSDTTDFVIALLFASQAGREAHTSGKIIAQINSFADNGDIELDIDARPAIPATSGFH